MLLEHSDTALVLLDVVRSRDSPSFKVGLGLGFLEKGGRKWRKGTKKERQKVHKEWIGQGL